jgi:hypothetical protein
VPDVAIYATSKKLTAPSYAQGFDKLHEVPMPGHGAFEVRGFRRAMNYTENGWEHVIVTEGAMMANERKTTTNHEEIRRWVDFNFPGADKKDVDEIAWEEFFKTFDRQNLAFEYEETPPDQPNPFCRLVSRDTGEPVSA